MPTRFTAAALAMVLLAACGSEGREGSDGASATGGNSSELVASSQRLLDLANTSAVTGPPAGEISADKIAAWKAGDVPVPAALSGAPVEVAVVAWAPVGVPIYASHLTKSIGEKLGWTVKVYQAAVPSPQGAGEAMQQAILSKPDVILTAALPAEWITAQLKTARERKIPTVGIYEDPVEGDGGYDAYVPSAQGVQKTLVAAYIVATSKGKASSLLVSSPTFADAMVDLAESYLKSCASCTTEHAKFPADVFLDPTSIQNKLTAALARGKFDYMLWPNGGAPLQGALNSIRSSRSAGAKIVTNAANPASVQPLIDKQLAALASAPDAMLVLAGMDQASRLVSGKPAIDPDLFRYPITYWTPDNAPAATFPAIAKAQLDLADYLAPYESAWGVELDDAVLSVKN